MRIDILGMLSIGIAIIGLIMKTLSDIKKDISAEAVFHTRTEEKLNLVNYRLDNVERSNQKIGDTVEDLLGYMKSNSDYQTRKH